MACVELLSRLGIYCIFSYSYQRHGKTLANSISVQQILIFSWCQSSLLVDHCDTCWWILSGWFLGRRVSFGVAKHLWYPANLWLVVLFWVFASVCPHSAALVVSISCRQCWSYKNLWRLAPFVGHLKNGGAEVEYKSHR